MYHLASLNTSIFTAESEGWIGLFARQQAKREMNVLDGLQGDAPTVMDVLAILSSNESRVRDVLGGWPGNKPKARDVLDGWRGNKLPVRDVLDSLPGNIPKPRGVLDGLRGSKPQVKDVRRITRAHEQIHYRIARRAQGGTPSATGPHQTFAFTNLIGPLQHSLFRDNH